MNSASNPTTIICVFDSMNDAQSAVQDLVQAGVSRSEISLMANDGKGEYASSLPSTGDVKKTTDGTTVGENVAAGAGFGALGGLLLGLGALAIPGVGPIVAAGPLAAALGGAAVGAAGGGVIGALKDAGVPDDDAQFYNESLRRGGVVVSVHAEAGQEDQIGAILDRHNAVEVGERIEQYRSDGWNAAASDDIPTQSPAYMRSRENNSITTERPLDTSTERLADTGAVQQQQQNIPVVQETLDIGKRSVQSGGVRVFSRLVEEPVEQQVSLREEKVRVDRRPVNRPATEADFNPADQVIEVTEMGEEAVINKRAFVTEEVVVGKETTQLTETVRNTLRHTDVQVENTGAQNYDTDFRNDFQTRYGNVQGATYDTYAPAYQYGSQMAGDTRYQGKSYNEVESTLKTDYLRNNPNSTWDNAKGAVRYGWEKVTGQRS